MHLSPAATEDAIRLLDGRQSGLEVLALRLYAPKKDVTDGAWAPSPVKRVS